MKRVDMAGRVNAEFRLDALNVFNNVNFAPVSGLTTSTANGNVNFNRMSGSAPASYEMTGLALGTSVGIARVLQVVSRIRW